MISGNIKQKLNIAPPRFSTPAIPSPMSSVEKIAYIAKIKDILKQKNAVIVAHYYVDPDIQDLAQATGGFVGDSLAMARFGCDHPATTLMVVGVSFMGESAKILSPHKKILIPTPTATCSLDLGCPADEFQQFCAEHPDRTVVVYANTSAAVKACADWVVTSSCGVEIVRHLDQQGEKILWASDRFLGDYIQKQTGADMLLWYGSCIIHDEFKAEGLAQLKILYPEAAVLVHPESPASVIALADVVGSTTQLINAVATLPHPMLIVATEVGVLHQMRLAAPDKQFIEAPTRGNSATCQSCARCPWMKQNTLANLAHALENETNEVHIEESIRVKAERSLMRMLNFSARS